MLRTLDTLLSEKIQDVPYIVYPILPRRGRLVIGASPKSLKSMLAINMAYEMAEGWDVLGMFKPRGPMTVLVVEQEIGPYGVRERMERIHGNLSGQLAPYNMYVVSKDLNIRLDTPQGLGILKGYIAQCKPQVLILDPLRKFHMQEEDKSNEMVKIFHELDKLEEEFDLSTIIVHHNVKRSEWRDPTDPESLRGSGEIFADADSVMMVEKPVKNNDSIVRLHFTLRRAQNPYPIKLRMNEAFCFERLQQTAQ